MLEPGATRLRLFFVFDSSSLLVLPIRLCLRVHRWHRSISSNLLDFPAPAK